mmetsp:Transcript_19113/g.38998  ORF Transcript_19113/g.38998 Transcript_19113/m.38998 type:complete len:381 (-) Transcript_19113:1037-2179(-)
MKYTKLSTFLNRKLWYQFGKLIQDLLIFVKNSKLVSFKEKGDLWFLYGKSTLSFYVKFKTPIQKNIFELIPYLVISGIIKYELFYIEDRISFMEREILNFENNTKSTTGEFIILSVLIYSKICLGWGGKLNKWFSQLNLLKRSRQKISLLGALFNFFEGRITDKSFFYGQNQVFFSVLSGNKLRYKKSVFKIPSSIESMFEFYQKKTSSDLKIFFSPAFMEKMVILRASLSNNKEKNNWFTDCHLFRTKYKKKRHTLFLQKPVENFFPQFFSSWVFRIRLFNNINFVLTGKKMLKSTRWSEIGRLTRFTSSGFGLVLLNFCRIVQCKAFINQNRQLIKVKKNQILVKNAIKNYQLRKNIRFLKILKKFSDLNKTSRSSSI